ncbi:MAG: Leucine-, isoleucine-, valine-, threonine-, and alanine-binding protein precursor [Syntrophorhabdus sp. PtaB.Bin184]|jgi:branched-chain amino acid transport system substrate-binding protein|nr:MAG: Leucine-, isoleucine-, valine-, threonine-, and alanine-binding protein precursor [Syntrophorhabdus sp. PtaB.Bin184]
MQSRRFTLVMAAVAFILFSFVSAVALAQEAPKSIKIGASISLTGRFAAGGIDVADGYKLAVKHINDKGGILVKQFNKKIPVELVIYDDESDPSKTVTRLEKLNAEKVVAYLGEFASDMNIAGLGIAEKNKIPWVGVTIAVENVFNQGFKYIFGPNMFSFMEVAAFLDALDKIPENQRPKKIANFELQVDWGKECTKYLHEYAKKKGYTIALERKFAPDTKDFSSMIMAAKSAGCDAVFAVPTPPQSMTLIKQMKELDYAPKATCFVRGPDLSNFWQVMGKDANYIMTSGEWTPDMPYPGNKQLVADYRKQYPNKLMGMPVGNGYSAFQVLADAISRAEKLDRESIRQALTTTSIVTVKGKVTFDKRGVGNVPHALAQWQNGKLVVIVSPDYKTAPVLVATPWSKRK